MSSKGVIQLYRKFVIPCYKQYPLVMARGKGANVWDIKGKKYLDFFPGWAVSGLGHAPPEVVAAIKKQSKIILHIPNNYYNRLQGKLAERLSRISFGGKCFFCNSGTEANEAAIKLARLYGGLPSSGRDGRKSHRYEIISMENSFHGRTLATLTLTGQKKVKEGFAPLPEGFKIVPFNNLKAVQNAITKKTVAIFLEPIQGEGGINIAKRDYLLSLRRLCDRKKILLIFDEVQTGMGRTGKFFCYQNFGVVPDVMTLAKSLGGGFPIGALIAKKEIADLMVPGTHASTFGGSPLACSAALAVLETIEREHLLRNTKKMGKYLEKKLENLKRKYPFIKEIRGMGLMLGVELKIPGQKIVEKALKKGLLINCTQEKVLRIMPPLIVKKKEIDQAISILDKSLKSL
ncbi:MAG: aspartate aminotransferase family protein [Candidatus Omnitrophica bacterium]|nr:aspartate aminotransferase family protein [Candidatus Omnitrophota bacterium]